MVQEKPSVLFVALQTGNRANGGIASIGEVITSLRRHKPVVLTNLDSEATRSWRALGIDVHVAPESASLGVRRAPFATAATYVRYFTAIRRLHRKHRFAVAHANDPLAFQLALPAIRSLRGVGLIMNMRDTLDPDREFPSKKYRWLFGNADRSLFLSSSMIERWQAALPHTALKASHTYSIVDFDQYRQTSAPKSFPPNVLVSGVLCPKKGQLFFLEKIAPLLAADGIKCLLAGNEDPNHSDYARKCREAAEPLGDGVEFLGYRADVADLIRQANVICVASKYEGLMRTMIEAMASGRPVVSTDVASARELLEIPQREAGFVFTEAEPEQLAAAIVRLCRDRDLAEAMGANGAQLAREYFQRDGVVAAYEDCYSQFSRSGGRIPSR